MIRVISKGYQDGSKGGGILKDFLKEAARKQQDEMYNENVLGSRQPEQRHQRRATSDCPQKRRAEN